MNCRCSRADGGQENRETDFVAWIPEGGSGLRRPLARANIAICTDTGVDLFASVRWRKVAFLVGGPLKR